MKDGYESREGNALQAWEVKQYAMFCEHKNSWKIRDILSQSSLLDLLPLFPLIFDTCGYSLAYDFHSSQFLLVSHFPLSYLVFFNCFILFIGHSMWDLSSPTRDRTHAPSIGSSEFNHWTTRESPSFSVIIPKSVSLTFTFLLSSRPKYSNIQRTHLLKNFTSSPMLLFLLHHQSSLPSWRNPPYTAYVSLATALLLCSSLCRESSHFLFIYYILTFCDT